MKPQLDSPAWNDNRRYDYTRFPESERPEYAVIASLVPERARIIDLGCGNGSLMDLLRSTRNTDGRGVEITESGVRRARDRGLDVLQGSIDEPLPFPDSSFDVAICNVTIQMVMYPEVLLSEMRRLAPRSVVSFPNFGFYRNRLDLLFRGRMPHPALFEYTWYSTGHIHQLSLRDFRTLVEHVGGLRIDRVHAVPSGQALKDSLGRLFPNLFLLTPIVVLSRTDSPRTSPHPSTNPISPAERS